jgi:hypothetical protein
MRSGGYAHSSRGCRPDDVHKRRGTKQGSARGALDSPPVELPFGLNPYDNDPGAWGASLLNSAEILVALLDAAESRSVVEVGAYAGDFTRLLLLWAERSGAQITAIDPSPQPELEQLAREKDSLTLIRAPSPGALSEIGAPDAIILDGDHNYYTVSEELRAVSNWASARTPLVLLHDVCWPHARRDDYADPDQIPPEHRQPIAHNTGLYPGIEGVRPGGMPYHFPAAREGGPRNGVLTALEDYLAEHDELAHAIVPLFYGIGVVWAKDAPYADAVAKIVEPWDRNPLIERLERNRVLHLASSQVQLAWALSAEERFTNAVKLLDKMLHSRAFAVAELFLRVRQFGRPQFSRAEVRRVMNPTGDGAGNSR